MPQITGGCLCGQVRYSTNAEPAFTGVCHCTSCQKESGTAFNVVIAVPQSELSIQGSPKVYAGTKGDSGQDYIRRFCPNCGSTILSEPALRAGHAIRIGPLDDAAVVELVWDAVGAPPGPALMARLSDTAYAAYRSLVYETPGFERYFAQSTPLQEIADKFDVITANMAATFRVFGARWTLRSASDCRNNLS